MKEILLTSLLLLSFIFSFSQDKVERTFEVLIVTKSFNTKVVRVELNLGKDSTLFLFKDPSVKQQLKKVESFQTIPDVLNYLSLHSWNVAFAFKTVDNQNNYGDYRFYFKRTFRRDEIDNSN